MSYGKIMAQVIKDLQTQLDTLKNKPPKKEGPEEGEECFTVSGDGEWVLWDYSANAPHFTTKLKQGNLFYPSKHTNPKEAAQMHALRVESLGWGEVIEEEDYFYWDFEESKPYQLNIVRIEDHFQSQKFYTKKRCQEWGDRFAKSWEYFNNPDNFIS